MEVLSYAALGGAVGMVVGAVEILQRYRDAPFRAAFNGWAAGYLPLNAAVSYGTFWILYYWIDAPVPDASGQTGMQHLLGDRRRRRSASGQADNRLILP